VPDHTRLGEAARAYGPTLFGGLPRFYEKAYEALEAERAAASPEERAAWDRALELGRRRSAQRRGAGDGGDDEAERAWADAVAPFAARLKDHFGDRVRLATSGGAALPQEVAETLDALGLTVLGAYGLTEHLCAVFNRPDAYGFDSAGPPMPGTTLRIADDGEILILRSDLTFAGYHGRPAESRQAFTADGSWLLTGDLGELDERGFLRVTGRKKELIALSTGKKVAPVPVEARLMDDPWIAQAVLVGEGRKFIAALLTLRRPVVEGWARAAGVTGAMDALTRRPDVVARVQAAVDRVNAGLSRTEQVRRFVLLDRELSLEEDELTPTMKIRRSVVLERFHDLIDDLYT
jgi:long-chain acyl-CoA synthetase